MRSVKIVFFLLSTLWAIESFITMGGTKVEILRKGKGQSAQRGNSLIVHYTGYLPNGKKFDSSLDRKEPFRFRLGEKQVIAGWEEGMEGMKVGEKRKLTIPPEQGYGQRAVGPIPANSTLIFEVELLEIR